MSDSPFFDQIFSVWGIPVVFQVGMAFLAKSLTVVMAVSALQWLQARAEQAAFFIFNECAPVAGIDLHSNFCFIFFKSG